ncbi:MAG: dicarboxylate--CoA ligase PimA, partial [Alphaproteobacteria bacterium CG_4_10_14_0_8_um_filter_53_9]
MPDVTLPDMFLGAARAYPERIALDFMGREMTYAKLAHEVGNVAASLQLLGVSKGTRVALMLPNCPYYPIFYYAVLLAGGVVVNLNPLYTAVELEHIVGQAKAEIVVSLDMPSHVAKLLEMAENVPVRHVITCPLGPWLPWVKRSAYEALGWWRREVRTHPLVTGYGALRAVASGLQVVQVAVGDVAVLQPTGGTTGIPKLAALTHGNLVANAAQSRVLLEGVTLPENGRVFLCVLPFFHVFANTALLNLGLATGARLVMMPRFEMKDFLATLRRVNPTLIGVVPALLQKLAENKKARRDDFAGVGFIISGGAPLPVDVAEAFTEKFGVEVHEGYGLTEASPVVACNAPGKRKLGSVGRVLAGTDVKFFDLDNPRREVGVGVPGHIVVRGPQVMQGYDNNPEETKLVLKKGWLHTGDIGMIDEDGYVHLTDRAKDIVMVSGFKIFPRQVEDALRAHPDVAEIVVLGLPHRSKGEQVVAVIRAVEGRRLTEEDVAAFAKVCLNPLA